MIQTTISLPKEDIVWLDEYSKKENMKTDEIISEAIKHYKEKVSKETNKVIHDEDIILSTAGIWKDKNIDGLEYIRKLRDEWQ